MTPSDHVSNTDYHEWLKKEQMTKQEKKSIVTDKNKAKREGVATFYGAGGRTLIKKMAQHFECPGMGKHSGDITAAGLIYQLLDGVLDIVRVSDGKGFWHEEGYDARPALIFVRESKAFTIWTN